MFNKIINESRTLFKLAFPLVAAQLAQTMIGVVDAVMAGRVSSEDLAAVSIGASLWFPLTLFVIMTLVAVTPFTARYFGSCSYEKISPCASQGLLLAIIMGLLCMFLVRHAYVIFPYMHMTAELQEKTLGYLKAVSWGIPAFAVYQVFRSVSEGLGKMWPVTMVGFLSLGINAPLNYVFIYGKLGFPEMGGVGCGWASSASMIGMCIAMWAIVAFGSKYREVGIKVSIPKPDFASMLELLKVGVPIGLSVFAEAGIFGVIGIFVARFGADTVAAHQIALSFAGLVFMIPLGLSMAMTVRIGHELGADNPEGAKFASFTGVGLSLIIALVAFVSYNIFAEWIARMYTNIPVVIAIAVPLIRLAALFQFSDVVQVCSAGALRGYKDTAVPMYILVMNYWLIAVPLGYFLGVMSGMGIKGFWVSLIVGLTGAAIALFARLVIISRRFNIAQ